MHSARSLQAREEARQYALTKFVRLRANYAGRPAYLPAIADPYPNAAFLVDLVDGHLSFCPLEHHRNPDRERCEAYFISPDITNAGAVELLDEFEDHHDKLFALGTSWEERRRMIALPNFIDIRDDYDEVSRVPARKWIWQSNLRFGPRTPERELYVILGRLHERAEMSGIRIMGDLEAELFELTQLVEGPQRVAN